MMERKRENEKGRVNFGDLAEGRNRKLVLHIYKIYVYIVLQWCSVDCCLVAGSTNTNFCASR